MRSLLTAADVVHERLENATAGAICISAILSKAFRGELTPSEADLARREGADYETAAELERIRAGR